MTKQNRRDLEKILDHYGIESQIDKLVEEAAELIVECEKAKRDLPRGEYDLDKLVDEIADVEVVLWQLKYFYKLFVRVGHRTQYKIERTIERMSRKK